MIARVRADRVVALVTVLIVATSLASCGGGGPSGSDPQPRVGLVAIGAGLDGPSGLHAVVYAKGPHTLANFAFDDRGRLWMTAAGLEGHAQDGVYVVATPGEPAQRIVSGLADPIGLAWYRGELYVASVGRVDAYWGFDGTRFSGHRQVLSGPLHDGENNHLLMGPDGRFLMGVSASCDHCAPTSPWDGAIVSFRPDGSGLRVYASGIRAPIGLAYLPGSDDLFVTMNQEDNLGAQTPGDALAIVAQGQDWRFPGCHDQGGPECAGVPAPVALLDRHAAVGGVALATGQLGPSVGPAAIVAEWNSGKVQRVTLAKAGDGYRGSVTPFLTGMEHPLAVAFAPNGALLVGDWSTGTVYEITQ
jgi:glucose/arabinose dehydrogenase